MFTSATLNEFVDNEANHRDGNDHPCKTKKCWYFGITAPVDDIVRINGPVGTAMEPEIDFRTCTVPGGSCFGSKEAVVVTATHWYTRT